MENDFFDENFDLAHCNAVSVLWINLVLRHAAVSGGGRQECFPRLRELLLVFLMHRCFSLFDFSRQMFRLFKRWLRYS